MEASAVDSKLVEANKPWAENETAA